MQKTFTRIGPLCIALLFLANRASAGPWMPLFDGWSLSGWTSQDGKPVNSQGWEIDGGMIHLDRSKGRAGNIITDRDYGNFELVFEWKISPRGNNGIKYRVKKFEGRVLGLEYQVIDDAAMPRLRPKHRTGSLYDVYDTVPHDVLKPAGEFNRGRIVVQGDRIEHWLNGYLVMQATVGSEEWDARIASSKFADVEGFGRNQLGRIMITDHNDEVWYRNVFIRELPPAHHVIACQTTTSGSARKDCCTRFKRRFFRRRCR